MSNNVVKKANNATWKFASNHLNVALMLSIGMIPNTNILGKKYYKDSLSWFDGYIPVFKKIPNTVLKEVIEEDKNTLKPCIVLFKKNLLEILFYQGVEKLPALIGGHWQLIAINDELIERAEMLLIPAPISLSNADKVLFENLENKTIFDNRIADSSNSLTLTSKVLEKEFFYNIEYKIQYDHLINGIEKLPPLNFDLANAMTAVINHLIILSRTNQMSSKLLTYIKDGKSYFNEDDKNEQLLLEIGNWIRSLEQNNPMPNAGSVFIQLCQKLIVHKHNFNYASPKDIVLSVLEGLSNNNDQSLNFVNTLRDYLQFSNYSLQQLLEQYPQSLRRAIILFVSKDDVLELWNKIGIECATEPLDTLLASILFAVSRGWQGLSCEFKYYANNTTTMQDLLVSFSKNISIQSNPSIINDINMPLEGVWQGNYKGKLKQTVLALINHYQWDCAEDEFLLPEGVELNARGGKIVIRTKAQSVKVNTIIDEAKFLDYLSGLNWFDFQQDEILQKLIAKK